MSSDLQALLAAIVSNPADDLARLVYADCLEEHGNAPRAAFIRAQVEAERLHPHSNARAALEAQAEELFTRHWVEWWGEVCATVGMPPAAPDRYRVVRPATVGFVPPEVAHDWDDSLDEPEYFGRCEVAFRRGFPEAVTASRLAGDFTTIRSNLAHWSGVSPLAELAVDGWLDTQPGRWPDGPHLGNVRALTFNNCDPAAVRAALHSQHLSLLESVTLTSDDGGLDEVGSGNVLELVRSPQARQLTHIDVPLAHNGVETIRGSVGSFAQLKSVGVDLGWRVVTEQLAGLSSALRPANILRLSVRRGGQGTVLTAVHFLGWEGLRYFDWVLPWSPEPLSVLLNPNILPELEELRLTGVRFTPETVNLLVRSPLLKRLKHFALLGGIYNDGRALLPLVDAVDPERMETFAVGVPYFPERAANALRAKFGDKFRLLPA